MESGIFGCPLQCGKLLPPGIRLLSAPREIRTARWDVLALAAADEGPPVEGRCGILLVSGLCPPERLARIQAQTVITCGLSPRDSLTLSSLTEPVLCVQRALPRPDGTVVEPQEFPLPPLPCPAQEALIPLGLRLLQMPLTQDLFAW